MASLDSDIASLSAQALNNLSKGSFQESSRIWSCVLRQLLPHVLDSSEDGGGAVFQFGGPARCGGVQIRCLSSLESTPSPTGDRIFAVFPRFFLPEESSTYGWTLEDYRLVAAATVYNIALSHHLQGLLRSDNREDYVKALKAYKAARDLLCSATADFTMASGEAKLLALAISNNEGHLLEQSYDLDAATSCLHRLHSLLPHMDWSEDSVPFLLTAVLFPDHTGGQYLHAPIA